MKNLNILKRFGEWVIKLKTKLKISIKIFLIFLLGIAACSGIFLLVDTFFNGVFIEWFDKNYTLKSLQPSENGLVYSSTLNWGKLKPLVFVVIASNMVLWLSVVMIVFYNTKRITKQATINDIGKRIHTYMSQQSGGSFIFPDEYAPISAEMAEVQSIIMQKERVLKDESERKNNLIAYLAHDLKTPLTSVIGYLSLLEEAPDMPAVQRAKYVHISLDKALRLEKLINEFFEITRYNLQQINLEKETIDLSYMLVQMADEFYPILKEHGNNIELNVGDKVTAFADPIKLARVFNNILKNAVAYSYSNSLITIEAASLNDCVTVSFQNRGKTISKQQLDSIFEKFFRLDEARNSNTGGAGLGLAIAKEIISLHGGTIEAVSVNETTTFTITLPFQNK